MITRIDKPWEMGSPQECQEDEKRQHWLGLGEIKFIALLLLALLLPMQTVWAQGPSIEAISFTTNYPGYGYFKYNAADDLSGLKQIHWQVAQGLDFDNPVLDKTAGISGNVITSAQVYDYYLPKEGTENQTLYVRAQVINQMGNVSDYTPAVRMGFNYSPYLTVQESGRYTGEAPRWRWNRQEQLNVYQVEIQDETGAVVKSEVLGNVDEYTYSAGLVHGKTFKLRVRGSTDGSSSWDVWSDYSGVITVDLQAPSIEAISFTTNYPGYGYFKYNAADDLSGLKQLHWQVAQGLDFDNPVLDKTAGISGNVITSAQIYDYYLPKEGTENQTLYVRAQVIDQMGNVSDYTPAVRIGTQVEAKTPVLSAQRYTQAPPKWTWTRVDGATDYEIKVVDITGGVLLEENLGDVQTFAYTVANVVKHGKTYIAYVRCSFDHGVSWNDWSMPSVVMIDLEGPKVQVHSFKRDGNYSRIMYSAMDELSGTKTIYVEFASDEAFTQIIADQSGPALSYNPAESGRYNLPEGDSVYVRIRADDNAGNMSEYTPAVRIDGVDEKTTEIKTSSYTSQAPQWSWYWLPGANAYQVEVMDYSDQSVKAFELGNTNQFTYDAGYVHGKMFSAHVRASYDNGLSWGDWSTYSSLTRVDLEGPKVQVHSFKRDGNYSRIMYSAIDELSGTKTIYVEFASDEAFTQIIADQSGPALSYNPAESGRYNLPEGDSVYVRIRADDNAGNMSEYTNPLKINTVPIDTPNISASSRYTNQAPAWSWNKVTNAKAYEVEVRNVADEVVASQALGNVSSFTYDAGLVHGETLKARVRAGTDGSSWGGWSTNSSLVTVDRGAPQVVLNAFERIGADSARVVYSSSDDLSGAAWVQVQVATDAAFANVVADEKATAKAGSYTLSGLPEQALLYARVRAIDYAGNVSEYVTDLASKAETFVLFSPLNGEVFYSEEVSVSGMGSAGNQVQLFLNDVEYGSAIVVDEAGRFNATVILPQEGNYTLVAKMQGSSSNSNLSTQAQFSYRKSVPLVAFVTPAEGAIVATDTLVEVSAIDVTGIAKVALYIDDVLVTTLESQPFEYQWVVSQEDNGKHTLKAVASNAMGTEFSVTRVVEVDVISPKPPVPATPYTGKVMGIEPKLSYGAQPITISGQAVDRESSQSVANSALQLVLMMNGFERRINLVSDSEGNFSYQFVPQSNDSGTYQVAVVHPKEVKAQAQGSFDINRIHFNMGGYTLTAARNIPAQITVNATASTGAQGLRWVVRAEDQPSGSLPAGIKVDGGSGIDVGAGASAAMLIGFTADDSAAETGTVVLVALAQDSGDLVRGTLQVNYRLMQAQPALYAQTSVIETGVQQGQSVTEAVVLGNRGLVAAQNVRVQLIDAQGNEPPSWVFLASASEVGSLSVGETVALQLIAQPDSQVAEGIYQLLLQVSASNGAGGTVPVVISVVQAGEGHVRFDVADIYTATLDKEGKPIQGVAGVSIKLQNEAVLSQQYSVTTNADGVADLNDLPAGIYIYRASAENHMDAGGRVRIRAGVTTSQHIFLDYQTVNIEFGVTETTVKDVYDVELEATYNTQVPAPVVLMDPLSINLGGMQAGEEKTGQITITNYGLVQADHVKIALPTTDDRFRYEFFAEVPQALPPKTRYVIPYKVTRRNQESEQTPVGRMAPVALSTNLVQPKLYAEVCNSYSKPFAADYDYECANGDKTSGNSAGYFYELSGQSCRPGDVTWGNGTGTGSGGGFGGTPAQNQSDAISKTICTPDCELCCHTEGHSNAK